MGHNEPTAEVAALAVDDPAGQSIEAVRPIRDDIKSRIEALLADLVPAAKP